MAKAGGGVDVDVPPPISSSGECSRDAVEGSIPWEATEAVVMGVVGNDRAPGPVVTEAAATEAHEKALWSEPSVAGGAEGSKGEGSKGGSAAAGGGGGGAAAGGGGAAAGGGGAGGGVEDPRRERSRSRRRGGMTVEIRGRGKASAKGS